MSLVRRGYSRRHLINQRTRHLDWTHNHEVWKKASYHVCAPIKFWLKSTILILIHVILFYFWLSSFEIWDCVSQIFVFIQIISFLLSDPAYISISYESHIYLCQTIKAKNTPLWISATSRIVMQRNILKEWKKLISYTLKLCQDYNKKRVVSSARSRQIS